MLKVRAALSLPGDPAKPNEDFHAQGDRCAMVLDGATPLGDPLMPGPSDAAWIAQFGGRRLLAHLQDGDAPRDALDHALADAQKSFAALSRHATQEKWQTPCASMMLAAETDAGVEFLWFGDCAALVLEKGEVLIIGETLHKRGQESARAKSWAAAGNLTAQFRSEDMLVRHRAARNHINSGRHWLFSPDPRAGAHVSHAVRRLEAGAQILLATDGFFALVSDYGAYDPQGLMAAAHAKGLAALGEQLRGIEDGDAQAKQFPRFKKSDDATAVLVDVG